MSPPPLFTIGHSTRSLGELVALLREHAIAAVADVRRYPRSRRFPWFNDEALAEALPAEGIDYLPFKDLGGRRRPLPVDQSPNSGWENEGFRGYADFMQTPEFEQALARLMEVARSRRTAVMCAEAVHFRCHRRLIGDAFIARGWAVINIEGGGPSGARPHEVTSFAHMEGTRVTYPARGSEQPGLFE